MAFVNLPPNLQDMFGTINDRIAKLETGPNQAMYTAVVANEQASQAINEATQALAQATQAYNIGSQSLIISSNTIVNASNQLTAINGSGITVYSGVQATSGARVVLNSAGLTGFNTSGTATFAIDASTGAVSTNGAIFTNSSISGGSLNINGACTIDSVGKLIATNAVITGTVTASAGSFAGSITSTSGSIGGFTIGSNYLTNSANTIRFAADTARATMDSLGVTNGAGVGSLTCSGNASISGTLNGPSSISAVGLISTAGNMSASGSITSGTSMTANGELYAAYGASNSVTNAANTWMSTTGQVRRSVPSSENYKQDIVYLADVPELAPQKLYDLPVRAYRYREEFLNATDDRYEMLIPGFISEEVDAIYPIAADYEDGPESWNDRILVPAMLALIQDLNKRVKELENNG